jgi:hypothetical protein
MTVNSTLRNSTNAEMLILSQLFAGVHRAMQLVTAINQAKAWDIEDRSRPYQEPNEALHKLLMKSNDLRQDLLAYLAWYQQNQGQEDTPAQ